MLLRRGISCPLCEVRSLTRAANTSHANALSSTAVSRSWPGFARDASTQASTRHRPRRTQLSPKVDRAPASRTPPPQSSGKAPSRGSPSRGPPSRGPVRSRGNSRLSPFGGMNRTSVPPSVEAERRRIEAREAKVKEKLQKRQSMSGRPGKVKTRKTERRPEGQLKALHMQRALSKVSYDYRNSIKDMIAEHDGFEDFPLLPTIQEAVTKDALRGLHDISPTPIQRLAIPALLGLRDRKGRKIDARTAERIRASGQPGQFLLAAETGSGKTLAYVLPIIDALKRGEARDGEHIAQETAQKEGEKEKSGSVFELYQASLPAKQGNPDAGRPKAIILVPSAELVEQVGRVLKKLSHMVKLRVAYISAAFSATVIRNRVYSESGVDMIVSTPHLLSSLAQSDPNILSRVSHVVVDEADSLFDRSFSPLTTAIIERATPSMKQLVLCSATIPRSLDGYLQRNYPEMQRLTTPNLHAIPRRVALSTIDVDKDPYRGNRALACADYIWKTGLEIEGRDLPSSSPPPSSSPHAGLTPSSIHRVIVFVNERESVDELVSFLSSKGIDAVALSRNVAEGERAGVLAPFVSSPDSTSTSATASAGQEAAGPLERDARLVPAPRRADSRSTRRLANTKVLVTTDLASRGIDTVALKDVILYDVPHTSIDFIHRLGRIGRMGRRGRGVVLVSNKDRKDVVSEIRECIFKGSALI